MKQTFLARKHFDERSEVHDPCDLACIYLACLDFLGQVLYLLLRGFSSVRVCSCDVYETVVIDIDPGLAFGTGNHPTTAVALSFLEKTIKSGDVVLDCGCGTGILAVAAGKLGAKSTYAVDIDHEAILATIKNIRINRLFGKIEVFLGDVTKRPLRHLAPFDVIIANIVADVIIPLLPHVGPLLKKGGKLICGGIISDRLKDVEDALLANKFVVKEMRTEGDWVTVLAERNN